MKVAFDWQQAGAAVTGNSVVTVGVFDGVHLGHRRVLEDTREWARTRGDLFLVVTFDRHPRALLSGVLPGVLTPLDYQLGLLASLGVDLVVVAPFDGELRDMGAGEFVTSILRDRLRARGLQVGYDGAFGRDAEGDYVWLADRAGSWGIQVRRSSLVVCDGEPVSSTLVRAAVLQGDLARARKLLGRPHTVRGSVVRGEGRGHQLGYPTANLVFPGVLLPPRGVYGVEVRRGGKDYRGVANLGCRPTFTDVSRRGPTVEVHLAGFHGDLYGEALEVAFLRFLRPERRFSDGAELSRAIAEDLAKFVDSGNRL